MGRLITFAQDLFDRAGQFRCNRGNHAWRKYDTSEGNGCDYGTYKLCARTRCMKAVYDLNVPAGHPDTKTIQFTPDQIAVLTELDKSFSEETR